jgi:hypothetical protein
MLYANAIATTTVLTPSPPLTVSAFAIQPRRNNGSWNNLRIWKQILRLRSQEYHFYGECGSGRFRYDQGESDPQQQSVRWEVVLRMKAAFFMSWSRRRSRDGESLLHRSHEDAPRAQARPMNVRRLTEEDEIGIAGSAVILVLTLRWSWFCVAPAKYDRLCK